MANKKQKIKSELAFLVKTLVSSNIAKHYNFHNFDKSKNNLRWDGFKNIAFTLKESDYETLYTNLYSSQDFSFLLIDGGIIQLMYRFNKNQLTDHTLAYYANPFALPYFSIPDEFHELYYSNEMHGSQELHNSWVVAFRFDYSQVHTDIIHPFVHKTYFGFKNCRIPINTPITPTMFIDYVLRNFYSELYIKEYGEDGIISNLRFNETISDNEKKIMHLNII